VPRVECHIWHTLRRLVGIIPHSGRQKRGGALDRRQGFQRIELLLAQIGDASA
jgi:hypothetical protein